MHETETIEGILIVRGTDWLKADPGGTRHVRLGGHANGITAELIRTALGWVGTTWLLQPVRRIVLSAELPVEWAVRELELAEAGTPDAGPWLPVTSGECAPCLPGFVPYGVGRYLRSEGHRSVMIVEDQSTVGEMGVPRCSVVLDDVLLIGRDGRPRLFESPSDALEYVDRESGYV